DVGDWALACSTDLADPNTDSVIVVNGVVVAREGDPVDLDGNGAFDDDAFIGHGTNTSSAFKANALHLTNDGQLYAILNLRDGAGNSLGSVPSFGTPDAFVVIDLAPQLGTAICDATIGGTTAPCGCPATENDGSAGVPAGCRNANNAADATLTATGTNSIALQAGGGPDRVRLRAANMQP